MIQAQRFTFLVAIISWLVAIGASDATAIAGIPGNPGDTTADAVLGQVDFARGTVNFGGPRAIEQPFAVTIDSAGHLYIADSNMSLVLGWHDVASFTNGAAADLVIGQTDFYSYSPNHGETSGIGADTLDSPEGVAVDSNGNLYVYDSGNSRVLEYNTPFAGFDGSPITGLSANLVFGQQGSFKSSSCYSVPSISFDGLCVPYGIAVDPAGDLYVADTFNSRVLEYNTPLKVTGVPGSGDIIADLAFGPGGTLPGDVHGLGPDSLTYPRGVAVDSHGNVYIADSWTSRVLEYNTPLEVTAVPGSGDTIADTVFGQNGSFTSAARNAGTLPGDLNGIGPDSLWNPTSVAIDSAGNVYVADLNNNRVLGYQSPLQHTATPGSGDTIADTVFGQDGSFTKSGPDTCNDGSFPGDAVGVGPDSLCNPIGLGVDPVGNLYVGDLGTYAGSGCSGLFCGLTDRLFANNRLLEYNAPLQVTGAPGSGDTNADLVVGQVDLFHNVTNFGGPQALWLQSGVEGAGVVIPAGLAVDPDGHLYVADPGNSRVLGWHNAASFTNGAAWMFQV
jgi:sugar lactone lactonase YvrE